MNGFNCCVCCNGWEFFACNVNGSICVFAFGVAWDIIGRNNGGTIWYCCCGKHAMFGCVGESCMPLFWLTTSCGVNGGSCFTTCALNVLFAFNGCAGPAVTDGDCCKVSDFNTNVCDCCCGGGGGGGGVASERVGSVFICLVLTLERGSSAFE